MARAQTRRSDARDSALPEMRDEELREHDPVREPEDTRIWAEPKNLSAPPPRPGYVQRWCRTEIRGEMDHGNYMRAVQLGWEPRRADTVKGQWKPPTIEHGRFEGFIGSRGMLLMEMPIEKYEARRMRNEEKIRRQTEAVNRDILRVQRPQVPFSQQTKTEVKTGTKRRTPVVADDDDGD